MLTITPMKTEHIDKIAALEAQCFSCPRTKAQLTEELDNPSAVFLVAQEESFLAGYCGMHHVLDEGYVDDVAVVPAYRRMGVGIALMLALEQRANQLGLSFISLEVRKSNIPAISLYAGLGYVYMGTRKGYYSFPSEDALIYTKQL